MQLIWNETIKSAFNISFYLERSLKPAIKEFKNDVKLKRELIDLSSEGKNQDNLYVITHNNNCTDRIADSICAGKLGEDFTAEKRNVFTKKGEELRAQLKELGFRQEKANPYEEKLDYGTI